MKYTELSEETSEHHTEEAYRYAMVLEYLGSSYAGSQIQLNQRTIQSELNEALRTLTKLDIKTIFSGRTDAGVHSKGQVVHVSLPERIETRRMILALNAILPRDISVKSMIEVETTFHAQKSAISRWYRFTINNRPCRSVWFQNAMHVPRKLNVEEMSRALQFLKGTHDFSSFKGSNTANPARVCTMYKAECRSRDGIIYIDLVANRFLYNMVRVIVGTLIDIGLGKYPAEHMKDVLEYRDRTQAGPTARPEGLVFMQVGYSKKYNLELFNKEAIQNEDILCKAS